MPSKTAVLVALGAPARQRLRLDDYLPYRLSVAANAVSGLIARAYVERFGLSPPQWRLMAVLADEAPLTQQALGSRTLMDKVTVTRAARGLQERKLIKRLPNAQDGRSHRLILSPAGDRLYAEIAPLAFEYQAALLKGMDPAEVRRFEQWLRRLQQIATDLARDRS